MKSILIGMSAVFGVLSAVLWIASAHAAVPYQDRFGQDGQPLGGFKDEDGNDVVLTAKKQSRLSAWAAYAASALAVLQTVSLFLPD